MALNYSIIQYLICPECRAALFRKEPGFFVCSNKHRYTEVNGVPILRKNCSSQEITPQGGDGVLSVENILLPKGLVGVLQKIIGTNFQPYQFDLKTVLPFDALALNCGAGMSAKDPLLEVNLDYFMFPTVDLVADVQEIPFADSTFDCVKSEFLIEHVKNPFQVCSEMLRVLKPGGVLYISYPFIHAYHSFPGDYFRFTHSGMLSMFGNVEILKEGVLTGPACRWVAASADLFTFFIKSSRLRAAIRALILSVLSPIKLLDLILNRFSSSKNCAVTLYSVFRKL